MQQPDAGPAVREGPRKMAHDAQTVPSARPSKARTCQTWSLCGGAGGARGGLIRGLIRGRC